jgi:thiol-disulfide isomerase/thioredoxin
VLNFWAEWCPPCREEMPSLDRLQAAYGGDHLVVMAMSEDRGGEEQIREFYGKIEAANLGIFSDPTQNVAREFRVLGMPTTFIIDHHGKLVAKLVGGAAWDSEAALSQILPLVDQAAADDGDGMSEQASNDVAP